MHALIRPWWRRLSDGFRERQALAFLRTAAGLFFLCVGFEKFRNPDFPALMAEAVKSWAAAHPQAVYQAFLETVVLPNHGFFARFVMWAELFIGLSYVTGGLIRYSAPLAMLLNVNFLLATQHTSADALGINLAFLGVHLTLLWGRAGCCYGLDALFLRWFGASAAGAGSAGKSSSRRLKAAGGQSMKGRRAKPRSDARVRAAAPKTPARVRTMIKTAAQASEKNVSRLSRTEKMTAKKEEMRMQSQTSDGSAPSPISPRIRDLRDS